MLISIQIIHKFTRAESKKTHSTEPKTTYGTDEEPVEAGAMGESGDSVLLIVFSMLLSE